VEASGKKSPVRDFTDLTVWKMAHSIRLHAYSVANKLPADERFNLNSQLKRASASICANVAEGYGRFSYQENIQFCRQARGSLDETRDHLIFINEVYPATSDDCQKLLADCVECRKVLNGYIKYLKERKEGTS
jgi:four helix bundle protein